MVYNKKYARKNKMSRRMPFSKKQVKVIKKLALQTGEVKEISNSSTFSSIVKTSALTGVMNTTIPQGDGEGQRIGDEITYKDIRFSCTFNSGTASGLLRVIAVQRLDNSTNGNPFQGLSNPGDINNPYPTLEEAGGRYKILKVWNSSVSSAGKKDTMCVMNIPYKSLPIKKLTYDPTLSTLSTNAGVVYFVVLTNNTTASQLTGSYEIRTRYYD